MNGVCPVSKPSSRVTTWCSVVESKMQLVSFPIGASVEDFINNQQRSFHKGLTDTHHARIAPDLAFPAPFPGTPASCRYLDGLSKPPRSHYCGAQRPTNPGTYGTLFLSSIQLKNSMTLSRFGRILMDRKTTDAGPMPSRQSVI